MRLPLDGKATAEERKAAAAALLFAPDWKVGCELIASEPWLLTQEADDELAAISARLVEQERADPNLISLVGAVAVVRERLVRARKIGSEAAFGDLIVLDNRFRAIAEMKWAEDLLVAVEGEPQLTSDLGIEELRLLMTRINTHDEEEGRLLWTLHAVLLRARKEGLGFLRDIANEQEPKAAAQAEQLFAPLRSILEEDVTREQIEQCERVLVLLEKQSGSVLWFDVQTRLGSFLLEARDGERTANVARARAIYQSILQREPRAPVLSWAGAACGYASCLIAESRTTLKEYEDAFSLLGMAIEQLRQAGDVNTLAVALGCYASALDAAAPSGDRDSLMERAIDALKEEVRVLGGPERNPVQWGRAHNNLAGLYMRRRGAQSQNVDDAVRALGVALEVRTRESDPIGRARVLRNLAVVLPEWSGADSLESAEAMATACREEADDIAREYPRAAVRPAEWGGLSGEVSALEQDLDPYVALPSEERVAALQGLIEHHRNVIAQLSRESTPLQWADWKGGLGRLLSVLAYSEPEAAQDAYENLTDAVKAVSSSVRPRMLRKLHASLGGLGHQVGNWDVAWLGYANALALSDALFDETATPDSRHRELADMVGFALFGAYAAVRLGNLDEAVRLAEAGRNRSMLEALAASEIIASTASPERRREIDAAARHVTQLEEELRKVQAEDPVAIAEKMRGRLADFAGVSPRVLKFRVTHPGPNTRDTTKDYIRIASDLRTGRETLRTALARARTESASELPERLDAAAVRAIAAKARCPIVYLLATAYGCAGIFVWPEGRIDSMLFDSINSDGTRALLHGEDGKPGYADGAMTGDASTLGVTLPYALDELRAAIMEPLAQHVTAAGHSRAVLIPLGSLGLLPLHAAVADATPAFAYAPSARALSRALVARARAEGALSSLLAIGNPRRDSAPPLPFAVAEVRYAANHFPWSRKTVLVGPEVRIGSALPAAQAATTLHVACHGRFRRSSPLESALLLSDEEEITLQMLVSGGVTLPARIAVLSACQTANVEFELVSDEVLGLPTGLLLVGVPGVVATMWAVDDRAAALFSARLYEELFDAKREPAEAVAVSQRWLRDASASELQVQVKAMRQALDSADSETDQALSRMWRTLVSRPANDRPFATPEFWAAFVYVGV